MPWEGKELGVKLKRASEVADGRLGVGGEGASSTRGGGVEPPPVIVSVQVRAGAKEMIASFEQESQLVAAKAGIASIIRSLPCMAVDFTMQREYTRHILRASQVPQSGSATLLTLDVLGMYRRQRPIVPIARFRSLQRATFVFPMSMGLVPQQGKGKSPPGVCPGDRLFKVDGESTESMSLEAVWSSAARATRPVMLHFLGPVMLRCHILFFLVFTRGAP